MSDNQYYSSRVSNSQLKLSYWYVTHKLLLKKILAWSLGFVSLVTFSYVIVQLSLMFFVFGPSFKQNMAYLATPQIDYASWQINQGAQDVIVSDVQAIGTADGKSDVVVRLQNPNKSFVAKSIVLQVVSNGEVIEEKETFLNGDEEKFVGIFALAVPPSSATVRVAKTEWMRIDHYEQFSVPRLAVDVNNVQFKSAAQAQLPGSLPISVLTFSVKNNTAYSYWQVGVNMVLFSGGVPVGVNFALVDKLKSGEERQMEIKWYDPLPSVNQASVQAEVNIVDPGNYMPVE